MERESGVKGEQPQRVKLSHGELEGLVDVRIIASSVNQPLSHLRPAGESHMTLPYSDDRSHDLPQSRGSQYHDLGVWVC